MLAALVSQSVSGLSEGQQVRAVLQYAAVTSLSEGAPAVFAPPLPAVAELPPLPVPLMPPSALAPPPVLVLVPPLALPEPPALVAPPLGVVSPPVPFCLPPLLAPPLV